MDRAANHHIEWDPENKILRVTLCGSISDDEFWCLYDVVAELVRALAPVGGILDFSSLSSLGLNTSSVRTLSLRPTIFSKTAIKVAVAPNDLMYGLSRMYQIMSNKPNIHVVRTSDEAFHILKLSRPAFKPVMPLLNRAN